MKAVLEDVFPIASVENDMIFSKQGDMTIGFEVTLPELFSLSEAEYEIIHQAWIRAIKLLPKGSIFHKQDWYIGDRYEGKFDTQNFSFLSHASERFFHERAFLNHQCFIYLTKKPMGRKESSSIFSTLIRPTLFPKESLQPGFYEDFVNAIGQFAKILEDSGFVSLRRLREKELASDGSRIGAIEQYVYLLDQREDRVIRDIKLKKGLQVGDNRCQLYTLCDAPNLPSLCGSRINYDKYSTDKTKFSIGFATPLGSLLPCNHIYNQFLFIEDAHQTIKRFEAKKLRLQSFANYSRENAIARDAVNDFLNEAITHQRLPIKAHFNVLVWSNEKHKEGELRTLVGSALAQMDGVPKQEVSGAPQIYWAGIPGNEGDFPMNDTFDTFLEQACCFLTLETASKSSPGPFGIRLGDRLNGQPLLVDLSDEPMKSGIITNRNKFVLGPSGSGKSFFTNHMVRTYYEQGSHVVLVDVGHSYKGLCRLLSGYYFTYEEKQPIRFNPFFLEKGIELDTEKKESIKTLLLALWKRDNDFYKRSEYVALSNALKGYYVHLEKNSSLFPSFNTFYEYLQTEFVNQLKEEKVKDRDFDVANFLYVLKPYYRGGEFDFLLNAEENLELLSQRFIVFELDNIKDHPILFPVVTIIIMEIFISKMRKLKGIRKMILIEEAWKAIAKEGMAEYIQYLFKTVRKFFGEAIVVTQEIEDIISSPIVKQGIINNSDTKILLDQSKYQNKFDQVQELLGLTEKEKTQVLSLNKANDLSKRYKEVFISLGGVLSKVYRTEVSPEEYLTYTTEEKEKMRVMEYAEKYGGFQEGIRVLATELNAMK